MLNHITQETRMCAQAMYKAMKKGITRDVWIQFKNITGYETDMFILKPALSLVGRKYPIDETNYFGTFVFKDNKLWVRMTTRDMEKYPAMAYFDFNNPHPTLYLGSQYRRNHYQPIPFPAKQYEILKERVKDIIRYQDIYGCRGFMFRLNYLTIAMFIVFDPQGNPYHLSDGYSSVERFFNS